MGTPRWALLPVDVKELQGALREASDLLNSIGIDTDIMKAKISRLDIFRDIRLQHSISDYIPLLASLHVPYHKIRNYYLTSICWGNKRRSANWKHDTISVPAQREFAEKKPKAFVRHYSRFVDNPRPRSSPSHS